MSEQLNIYQKLIEVRKAVPYLKKESEGGQYKYTGSSQVLGSIKSKMDELGLLLIPGITNHVLHESPIEYKDKEGHITKRTTTYFTELEMTMTWINAEKPDEKIERTWYAQGVDIAGEKGVGKALTYGEKYFILKFFNIPTDQMDADAFQKKYDEDDKKAELLRTNTIAAIKSEWMKKGFQANKINQQTQKLYQNNLIELSVDQAEEFLDKLKEGEKSA